MDPSRATIFVQIASYRDAECKFTVDDLFAKASCPDRVFVGLNWQFAEEDADVPFFEKPYRQRIRLVETPAEQSRGACWARHLTQSLFEGEAFTLQTDAHMRFTPGWDATMIEMHESLRQQGFRKPVLTHYPPDYYLPGNEVRNVLKKVVPFAAPEGIFVFKRSGHVIDTSNTAPLLTPCLSGGFLFAAGDSVQEIPYDPHLYFMGEEISLAVRYWTHGWDLFNPAKIVAYHLYKNYSDPKTGVVKKSRDTKIHRTEHDQASRLNRIALSRVRHLLGTQTSHDPEVIHDLGKYGLGAERSIHQYELFAGLRFSPLAQRAFTRTGLYFEEKSPLGAEVELQLLRAAEYSALEAAGDNRGGPGQLVLRAASMLGVSSLVDVGAVLGEQIETLTALSGVAYVGTTVNRSRVASMRMRLRGLPNTLITELNPAAEPLPASDIVLSNSLFHGLPDKLVWQLLESFCRSGAGYFAAIERPGRRTLREDPFLLPPPALTCGATADQTLVVWKAAEW